MPIPGDPLPISPALWTDTKTGRPTDQFYQYIFKLDNFVATNIAALNGQVFGIGSSFALLNTLTASGSVSLDDTADITSKFDLYMIELINLLPAVNGDTLYCLYQVSAVFQTTGYVAQLIGANGGTFGADSATVGVILSGSTNLGGVGTPGISGILFLHGPNSSNKKWLTGNAGWVSGVGNTNTGIAGGFYNGSTAAVTGLRFKFAGGNITSGLIKIWGIRT